MGSPVRNQLATSGLSRRAALGLLGAASASAVAGCCTLRGFPSDTISGDPALNLGTPLRPVKAPSNGPHRRIDVHAHFFNASDVTVKGYLEGPVAHDMSEPLAELIRLLAPFADDLATIAPTAGDEFAELTKRYSRQGVTTFATMDAELVDLAKARRRDASSKFFDLVHGSQFEAKFNALASRQPLQITSVGRDPGTKPLDSDSLRQATELGDSPDFSMLLVPQNIRSAEPYPGGILAFVGYMLSPRWANLSTYSRAFTDSNGAFGIDLTLGALVDFDRWLDCPPRSSHEDQIKLHQLLSKLSGGYMRPLVAYNPWSDIKEEGQALERVVDAVKNRGFVGVKLYPPNGFRPYGNTDSPIPPPPGPSPADLDRVLAKFWDACVSLGVPVMAHTGATMGRDDTHDLLGGPQGWQALTKRYTGRTAPKVNLGHFGGDCDTNRWTDEMAALMASADGTTIYGDLAYWSGLGLSDAETATCGDAKKRLARAMQAHPGAVNHVMYGSDWLMLSRERNWWLYPFDVANATRDIIDPTALFSGNAQSCFASLIA